MKLRDIKKLTYEVNFFGHYNNVMKWWLRQESNQRHTELQSVALPTELQSHGGPDGDRTRGLLRDREAY